MIFANAFVIELRVGIPYNVDPSRMSIKNSFIADIHEGPTYPHIEEGDY